MTGIEISIQMGAFVSFGIEDWMKKRRALLPDAIGIL
jgi:hypothetical protein